MRPWVPCEFCGQPGFRYPITVDLDLDLEIGAAVSYNSLMRTFEACEHHKAIVELRAERRYAPRRAAYREGVRR